MAPTEDIELTGAPEYIITPMRAALDKEIADLRFAERGVGAARDMLAAAIAGRNYTRERVTTLQAHVDRLEAGQ